MSANAVVTTLLCSAPDPQRGDRFADGDRLADGSHRAGEDSDLIKRMNAAGCRISHLPERTWRWHHHYGNTSGLPENRRQR